eukprot:scaffold2868_cov348-Pavlova_lutheri.AAC.10
MAMQLVSVGLPIFAWWKHKLDRLEGKPKRKRVRFQKEYPGSDFGKPGWEFLPRPCWTCGGLGLSKQQCIFCAGMGHISMPRVLNPIVNEMLGRKKRHFICKCFVCRGYGLRTCPDCDALYTKGGLLRPLARPDESQLDEWGMLKRPGWESIPLPERRRRAAPVAPGWKEDEDPSLKVLDSGSTTTFWDSPNSPIKKVETLVPAKKK